MVGVGWLALGADLTPLWGAKEPLKQGLALGRRDGIGGITCGPGRGIDESLDELI